MNSTRLQLFLFLQMTLFFTTLSSVQAAPANSKLFREYIGAKDTGVTFSDVPIDSGVEIHFILSFATDYTTSSHPKPTNGNFNVFWDTKNLSPSHVSAIKASHPNAKVALSLGGDTVTGKQYAYFSPCRALKHISGCHCLQVNTNSSNSKEYIWKHCDTY